MCLRAQGIDNDNGGLGGGRRARGLSNNDGGVVGGRGIYNAYKESETMTELAAEEDEHKDYNNDNGGVGRR